MTTNADAGARQPQPVTAPLTAEAIFLVLTIRPGGETTARALLSDLSGLLKAVGFRNARDELTCVVGIGSDAWDRLFVGPRPAELHPFRPIVGAMHTAPATPGDLLFHIRAHRFGLCFDLASLLSGRLAGAGDVVDEVHGFRYFDERDLLGFVDGTANPTGAAAAAATLVGDEDPAFRGGSYVVVQKYLHDLERWNALTVEQQERIMGRTKLDNIEIETTAANHVTLNTIVDDHGGEHDIVRDNRPFGRVGANEFGTYYIGYVRSPAIIERMLDRMYIGHPPGTYDRLLDVSTPVTGCLFFVPTVEFLDDLPGAPANPSTPATAARIRPS
jgi:porphyrinogen peroxidase